LHLIYEKRLLFAAFVIPNNAALPIREQLYPCIVLAFVVVG